MATIISEMPWDDDIHDEACEDEVVDEEDDSEAEMLACPVCRKPVHEDAQQCPHCGDWIIPVDPRESSRRWIWAVAAGLVIAGFVLSAML